MMLNRRSHETSSETSYSRTIELSHSDRSVNSDFVYYTVQPGDTLQNLSVKFSCPVASIKRLNYIWTDQEFHAKSKLKLPVGKFRLITEAIDQQSPFYFQEQQSQSLDTTAELDHDSDVVFKALDKNIERAKAATRSYDANAKAIMKTLAEGGNIVHDINHNSDPSNLARMEAETLLIDMSDGGLSYSCLILFMFIFCLICPLAIVIYLEETTLHSHEPNKIL